MVKCEKKFVNRDGMTTIALKGFLAIDVKICSKVSVYGGAVEKFWAPMPPDGAI